jgi:hypothetical protein
VWFESFHLINCLKGMLGRRGLFSDSMDHYCSIFCKFKFNFVILVQFPAPTSVQELLNHVIFPPKKKREAMCAPLKSLPLLLLGELTPHMHASHNGPSITLVPIRKSIPMIQHCTILCKQKKKKTNPQTRIHLTCKTDNQLCTSCDGLI